jgi:hypothetical protein
MKVTVFSGDVVVFDEEKLKKSLSKSGARQEAVENVIKAIEKELYEGIPTKKIYKLPFQQLKKVSNFHAAKYNLRSAIQAVGSAGFYFEKFFARLFEIEGFAEKIFCTSPTKQLIPFIVHNPKSLLQQAE